MKRKCINLAAITGFAALLCGVTQAAAQTAPSLGAAQSFAVLAGSTVTNTGPSVVTGDLGVSPGTAVTGFPPGIVVGGTIHSANAVALNAQNSVTTAYNALASQACTQNLTGQDLGNRTLTAGVYCFDSSAQLTGTLTLNAQGNANAVFIFNINSTLTTASAASVVLINGANPCNVFWRVGSSATLGTSTSFIGNILALTSITLTTNASVSGRTLARNGAVTLDSNRVTATCPAPPVCPAVTLTPATLPGGTVGVAYNQTITASGGTAPYTFTVTSGTLPAGLTLTPAGVLSGTPTTAGSSTITIRGTDANGCFGERTYTIVIAAAPVCPTISISPPTVPNGQVGVAYSQTLTASGGTAPYTFTVASGTLPAGLTVTPAGVLAGTPTTAGSATFTIRATDANGCFAQITYTIVVAPAACPVITISPPAFPPGTVGVAASLQLTASGGTGSYVFSVIAGTLPAGVTLTPGGLLSGTPTAAGSSTVTIQATDGNGCPGAVTYVIVIAPAACPVIAIAPTTIPPGRVGVAASLQLTASGGIGPYVFTVATGSLPAGVTLSSTGLLSGTPTNLGSSTVTIRVTDANNCPAIISYTVVIAPAACPLITLAPPTLPAGQIGVPYSQQITASGGSGSYTFTILSGALPLGLTLSPSGLVSGTPTTQSTSTVVIQGTDGNRCPGVITYVMPVTVPVPTMPQVFIMLLALALIGFGYLRLRHRAASGR